MMASRLPWVLWKFLTVNSLLLQFSTDRNQELSRDFTLVNRFGDGSISREDILALSDDVGDKVSPDEAEAMLKHASKKGQISQAEFAEIFAPP